MLITHEILDLMCEIKQTLTSSIVKTSFPQKKKMELVSLFFLRLKDLCHQVSIIINLSI